MVQIRAAVLEAIVAHARAACPRECCGLLIAAAGVIVEAVATENAADDPVRRFEISPIEHIRQLRRCRAMTAESGGPHAVIGAYHSHPSSVAEPSPTDIAQAFQEFVYVIAGPADADTVVTNAYRLTNDGMSPVQMEVC